MVVRKKIKAVIHTNKPEQVDPKLLERYRATKHGGKKRELYSEIRTQNKDAKRARRTKREKLRKTMRDRAPAKQIPKTKERKRKPDATMIEEAQDAEILGDEADDEFAKLFAERRNPKIMITTSPKPSFRTRQFVREAKWLFSNSMVRPRKNYTIKEISQFCINRGFTHLIVVGERLKLPHALIVSHLPDGPTAHFRLSNFLMGKELETPAERTEHYPELILKYFDTRLGRRVARMLESLFPMTRDYSGRAVATFHNQRDFIFLRVHRYIFDGMKDVRIQEMGPRFTLRLISLQQGTFDSLGEFEWYRKKEHETDRLEWYL